MQALRGSQQAKCNCSRQQQRSSANSRAVRLLVRATSHPQQPSFTSTAALTAAAAATVLQLCLPAAPALAGVAAAYNSSSSVIASTLAAAAAAAWQPVFGDVAAVAQLPAEQEDFASEILTEEIALPPQLMSFMELLQKVSR
jgi:hypothetical protein